MKKYLSLLLAIAMILTMVALPAAAAEEDDFDISLAASDDETAITVSYNATNGDEVISQINKVKPGETFYVSINVSADKPINVHTMEIWMKYNSAYFTAGTPTDLDAAANINDQSYNNNQYMHYIYDNIDGEGFEIDTMSTTLATVPFTVKGVAIAADASEMVGESAGGPTTNFSTFTADGTDYLTYTNITTNTAQVYLEPNAYTVTISGAELLQDKTPLSDGMKIYDKDGFTLTASGSTFTTLTLSDGTNTIKPTDGVDGAKIFAVPAQASGEQTYTLTVQVPGGATQSYTFTVSGVDISATLTAKISGEEQTHYIPGSSITIPVVINIPDGSPNADIVTFDVAYDATCLEMTFDSNSNQVIKTETTAGTASFEFDATGDIEGVGNNTALTTLTFTVKSDTTDFGVKDITFSKPKLAVVTQNIDPSPGNISFNDADGDSAILIRQILVAPDVLGEVESNPRTVHVKQQDEKAKVVAEAVEAKVVTLPSTDTIETDTVSQATAKENWENGTLITVSIEYPDTANITLTTEGNSYVIFRIGATDGAPEYFTVVDLKNMVDVTPPMVNLVGQSADDYVKEYTFTFTGETIKPITDNYSAIGDADEPITVSYVLLDSSDASAANFVDLNETATSYTVAEEKAYIAFKATDKAGNVSDPQVIQLYIDKTAPVINAALGTQTGDTMPIALTVIEAHVGSDLNVQVWYSASAIDDANAETDFATKGATSKPAVKIEEDSDESTENTYVGTYDADAAGWYYFIFTDKAGNKGFVSQQVTLSTVTPATLKVVTNGTMDATEATGTFLTDDELIEATAVTNGTTTIPTSTNGKFVTVQIDLALVEKHSAKYEIKHTGFADGDDQSTTTAQAYSDVLKFDKVGDYTLTITTQMDAVTPVSKEYHFSIVAADDLPSVNGDNWYNMIDYMAVRGFLTKNVNTTLPTGTWDFKGGYFSGDVTGDLAMTVDDYEAILSAVNAGEYPGIYTFGITNPLQTVQP